MTGDLKLKSRGIDIPGMKDMKMGIPNEPKFGKLKEDDIKFGKGQLNKFG